MKKFLISAIAIIGMVFAFCVCSDDEPSERSTYTEKQQKVFALYGAWVDYQFSNLSGGVGDPDLIVFGQQSPR